MVCGTFRRWLAGPQMWEREIRAFERADRRDPPRPGQILFTGSSSIRFWSSLADDMRPLAVVNRGFGGAHAAHVTHFAPRIVFPQRPRAIVLYAGDNDLGRLSPRTPRTVVEDFRAFREAVRARLGEVPLYVLSIKPTPLRERQWPRMEQANEGLAAFAEQEKNVHFVDVSSPMFDQRGRPRRDLYRWDGLHLNDAGYRLWTGIVKPRLVADLGT